MAITLEEICKKYFPTVSSYNVTHKFNKYGGESNFIIHGNESTIYNHACFYYLDRVILSDSSEETMYFMLCDKIIDGRSKLAWPVGINIDVIKILDELCEKVNSVSNPVFTLSYEEISDMNNTLMVIFSFDNPNRPHLCSIFSREYWSIYMVASIIRLMSYEYFGYYPVLRDGCVFGKFTNIDNIKDLILAWILGAKQPGLRAHNLIDYLEDSLDGELFLMSNLVTTKLKLEVIDIDIINNRIDIFLNILLSLLSHDSWEHYGYDKAFSLKSKSPSFYKAIECFYVKNNMEIDFNSVPSHYEDGEFDDGEFDDDEIDF